ncbi:MAG TPA: DUF763 domain-containing protein [Candidatus Paceibacterota bacterium]|nr:DUF763 domain-containing protein [Candidatus Paceibacterota bacterium]HRY76979.1 DUF763 domain-containing protein [Candidatus Paceibacterota bacterium]
MYRGIATFTLDDGRCPKWLFERMVKLGREITEVLIAEYGPDEFIRRIADPVWFQSLGTVLAFDWNASGLTTILTAALKEAIRGQEKDLGVFICGGKGKTSLKTPDEIKNWGEKINLAPRKADNLIYNSKMAAKVDSSLVQDGFQIYHHAFFFSKNGAWSVVQQGMNTNEQTARRYHWFSENIKDLVCEPHAAIASDKFQKKILNLVSKNSASTRQVSVELTQAGYHPLIRDINLIRKYASPLSQTVSMKLGQQQLTLLNLENKEFDFHPVVTENFSKSKYLEKILSKVVEEKPQSYEKLLAISGVGPKTMRALALVSEVIYGAKASHEDPARYSFALGGKDATPYPVDRPTYDKVIEILKEAVNRTHWQIIDKNKAIRRLEKRI